MCVIQALPFPTNTYNSHTQQIVTEWFQRDSQQNSKPTCMKNGMTEWQSVTKHNPHILSKKIILYWTIAD